jgi:IS5 family transposase
MVYISGQKRGIKTQRLKGSLKRREAIEPVIGHLKSDGLLGRNYLKGSEGDQVNVMLSCAGQNLRLVLRQLRIFCAQIWRSLWALLVVSGHKDVFKSRVISIFSTTWQPAINSG